LFLNVVQRSPSSHCFTFVISHLLHWTFFCFSDNVFVHCWRKEWMRSSFNLSLSYSWQQEICITSLMILSSTIQCFFLLPLHLTRI
jgi:hypothetical protein